MGDNGTGPGPKSLKDYTGLLGGIPRSSATIGTPTNVKLSEYAQYLPQGVNSSFNIDLKRAQNQRWYQQLGREAGNLVPNIVGSFIENIGYLGGLATEWGDDRDYNNAITRLGQSMHNPLGDLYREHPDKVWDWGDPASYLNAFDSLAQSATAFAAEGVGFSKLFGALGKLATFGETGTLARAVQGTIAHLGTAATLAYTEAAQFGGTTFDTVYKEQYQKFIDGGDKWDEASKKARHIAANAGAAAVQLNTIFATALNLGAIAPLFQDESNILSWFTKEGRRQEGETMLDWENRLRSTGANSTDVAKKLNIRKQLLFSYPGEAVQEGSEELINQWAEQRGLERGKEGKELHGLNDLLGDMGHFFDDTMNGQGALSFILGAFGGVAQTVLIDHIPAHQVYTKADGTTSLRKFDAEQTPDGKYKTKLISSHQREAVGHRQLFENTKDAVVNDIKRINEISTNLAKAISSGNQVEAERLRFQMFDTSAINSIQLGIGDAFSKQYEEIRNLDNTKSLHEALVPALTQVEQAIKQEQDPTKLAELKKQKATLEDQIDQLTGITEAMQKGFAKTPKDNEYKQKATDAVNDIKEYSDLWKQIQAKHSGDDDYHSRYADYLFSKEIDIRRKEKILKKFGDLISQSETNRDKLLMPDEDHLALKTVSESLTDNATRESLLEDVKRIKRAQAMITSTDEKAKIQGAQDLKDVAEKYLPNVDSTSEISSTMPKILTKIQERVAAIDTRFNKNMADTESSTSYQAWKTKNPGKTVLDYIKIQAKRSAIDEGINQDKAELKKYQEELNINKQFLRDLYTPRGRDNYISKAKETTNKIVALLNERVNKDNKAFIDDLFDNKSADELTEVQKKQYAESLTREKQETQANLDKVQAEYNRTAEARKDLLNRGLISRFTGRKELRENKDKLISLKSQITSLQNRLISLDNRLNLLNSSTTSALPTPTKTTPDIKATVADDQLDSFVNSYVADKATYDKILDDIYNLMPSTRDQLLSKAQAITNRWLSKTGHEIISLDLESQKNLLSILDRWINKHLGISGLVRTETDVAEDNANELIMAVKIATASQKRQANILAFLDEYEQNLRSGKETFSLNALADNGFVGRGRLSQEKAANIMRAFEATHADLLKDLAQPIQSTPATTTNQVTDQVEDTPPLKSDDIPGEEAPDSAIGQNSPTDIQSYSSLELDVIAHDGLKTIEAAAKINALTHDYEQDILKTEHGLYYVNKNTYLLNDLVNPLYLKPGYLKEGSEVQLVIDEEWDGTVNNTEAFTWGSPVQKNDRFRDYIDPKTTGIQMTKEKFGNMPVKIVDTRSGTTLGYLPRVDWIRAQYPNRTGDYRNVVDQKMDKEGNIILEDNVRKQAEASLLLREKLATAYNMGKKGGLSSKVTQRAEGVILRVKPGKVSELLPDPSLQVVLLGTTEVKSSERVPVPGAIVPGWVSAKNYQHIPGMLLPAANGKMVFEPIWTERVNKGQIDTIIRAIEIYLSVDGDKKLSEAVVNQARNHAREIEEATGFDVTTSEGLKRFINQFYTYTQGFSDQLVKANQEVLKGTPRKPKFMLAIADTSGDGYKKGIVKAGVTFLNRLSKAGVNDQGQINPDFRDLLEDTGIGLASRFRNVTFARSGIKGINTPGAITELVYQPKSQTFGKIEHKSYNDMIKAYSTTTAFGKLKLNTGEYVYFANPNTQLDYQGTIQQDIRVAQPAKRIATDIESFPEETTQTSKPQELTEAEKEYLQNLPDPLGESGFGLSKIKTVFESSGHVTGEPVSLDSLQKLLNFTPVENRNGKVPTEVLEELTKLGLTNLPEGFNPFYSC